MAFKILLNGEKDAYFIYYVDRKEKQKKIGRYSDMSLKKINSEYDRMSTLYNDGGVDIKERERQQAEAKEKAKREAERQAEFERM